jgi:uncharacterized membrane protein
MTLLILGLILFLGMHSVRVFADDWRSAQIRRVGPQAWKGIYSILSLAGFVLLVWGYGEARSAPAVLWTPPTGLRHLAALLTLVAFVLLAAAYVPGTRIKRAVGHPMVAGTKAWALADLYRAVATGTHAPATPHESERAFAAIATKALMQST